MLLEKMKAKNCKSILLILLVQTFLAVAAGVFILHVISRPNIPEGIVVAGVDIGGMSRQEAQQALSELDENGMESGSFEIRLEDGYTFTIGYREVDMRIDAKATIDKVLREEHRKLVSTLTASLAGSGIKDMQPVYTYNEGKLRSKLELLSGTVNIEPQNAVLKVADGTVVKEPEITGRKLNIQKALVRIKESLDTKPGLPAHFKLSDENEIQTVPAEVTLKDFEGLDVVLGEYTTLVENSTYTDSMKDVIRAMDGFYLMEPVSKVEDPALSIFSFNQILQREGLQKTQEDEGYNQIVSTLYAAVLAAGIEKSAIVRQPKDAVTDYIVPGLDAMVKGDEIDFRFSNTRKDRIAVSMSLDDNRFSACILGRDDGSASRMELVTEVVQKYEPSVIHVENDELKPGEKRVMSPGIDGVMVNVYRNGELISTDTYKAIKAVVEIGPYTGWYDDKSIK